MESRPLTTNNRRPRREHQKSRLGCRNCKKRRIKCDEQKPACSNCLQHRAECDFSIVDAVEPVTMPTRSSAPRYIFKPSQYQSHVESSVPEQSTRNAPKCISRATQCGPSTDHDVGVPLEDLRLFHHFTTSTHRTVVEPFDGYNLWQCQVPQWSIDFLPIRHLMLALSALHLDHGHPELSSRCTRRPDDHFDRGVQSVARLLPHLGSSNCQQIYISAMLICFVYFARRPAPGEYIAFSDNGPSEWLALMGGVRSILEYKSAEIFSGALEIKADDRPRSITASLQSELFQHRHSIEQVQLFIERTVKDDSLKEIYASRLNNLLQTFDKVYMERSVVENGVGLMHLIIQWVYCLPKGFVDMLERKDPFALIIFAYWSTLLKQMRSVWFMEGWDEHVVSGVRHHLPTSFRTWIEWPVRHVQHDGS